MSENQDLTIGDVARATGLTERTLRYYEELGLVTTSRDAGGRRRYDAAGLDQLSRVRLQRDLGTPLADIDPDGGDLRELASRHLADLDDRLASLARQRERVRAVEDRLLSGAPVSSDSLLDLLAGLGDEDLTPHRRVTLLVYRDLGRAHAWLVDVFGFAPGELVWEGDEAVHGELFVGDGPVWLHREAPEHRMVPPAATGGVVTGSMAVHVDDVDAHHARVSRVEDAEIVSAPVDQPYGFREYSVHDLEGHFWSFQQPLP